MATISTDYSESSKSGRGESARIYWRETRTNSKYNHRRLCLRFHVLAASPRLRQLPSINVQVQVWSLFNNNYTSTNNNIGFTCFQAPLLVSFFRWPSPPIEWVVDGVEGLANIAIHRFSMNNNKVIRRTCLLVRRSVLYMLGKPACSGFCNTTVLARLFRFHCWNRAAFFTSNNIHVQTTPTIHEYYCSRSWADCESVGKLWMAMFARPSTPSTTHSIGGEGQRPD